MSFYKSDTFNEVAKFLESKNEEVYIVFNDKKMVYDIEFFNLLTKEKYLVKDTGIWIVGIKSQHPNFYLLFKYNNQHFFEFCNLDKVNIRYNDYFKYVRLTDEEKLKVMFGIVKYLNECYNYPIESIISNE
jgi:hypothetical protein